MDNYADGAVDVGFNRSGNDWHKTDLAPTKSLLDASLIRDPDQRKRLSAVLSALFK